MSGYNAIAAKLRAMHAGVLTPEDYGQLLTKTTVGDVCAYLKQNTAYGNVLRDVNEYNIHRFELEVCLQKSLKNDFFRLYEFVDLDKRRMMQLIFMQEEIEFLKRAIRYACSEQSEENLRLPYQGDPFFLRHSQIDMDMILRARALQDVVEACKKSEYYPVLNRAVHVDSDPTAVVMFLDRYYFDTLWRKKNRFVEKADIESFSDYVGMDIDALNILWIYRCKKYFNTPPEFIYTYIIPIYRKLSPADVSSMVEAPDVQACEQAIRNTRYGFLLDKLTENTFLDENYNMMRYKAAKLAYKRHLMSITGIFAYFDLKQKELLNIKTIIEGVRYSVDPQVIREHIYIG